MNNGMMREREAFPDDTRQQIVESVVAFVRRTFGDEVGDQIHTLSTEIVFQTILDQALLQALTRFEQEYVEIDEDLTAALLEEPDFWDNEQVGQAILTLVAHPGSLRPEECLSSVGHFDTVIPQRHNRGRVDRAVSYLLRLIAEEVWTMPGIRELGDIAMLMAQPLSMELTRQQLAEVRESVQTATQLDEELHQTLIQIIETVDQRLLETAATHPTRTLPYHNLPQPDYSRFIGRSQELVWLRQRLSPADRAWHLVLTGPHGAGKSALALSAAHDYDQHYHTIDPEERFEAIIWFSCQEKVLTPQSKSKGEEDGRLPVLTFRTLQDIYTTIAHTLQREDIIRAAPLYQPDMFVMYEEGLNTLLKQLGTGHRYYDKVLVSGRRLTENIDQCRRYGDTNERLSRRTDLIDQFNAIAAFVLGISFTELCEQVTPPGSEEQDRLVQQALSQQRTLLIVDNLDLSSSPRVRMFLRHLPPPTKVIITSQAWSQSAEVLPIQGMMPDEANMLIDEEAASRGIVLDATQRRRLYDLTGGLPLPIKLSLARMNQEERFETVARWLSQEQETGNLATYTVHGQVALAREHQPHAWRVLLACTIFDQHSGASREAIGAVTDLPPGDRDAALTTLQQFGLINSTTHDRFWLLSHVRWLMGTVLDGIELREEMITRWLTWLVDFASTYGLNDLHVEHIRTFEIEYANIRQAIQTAQQHERWRLLLQLAERTWYYPYLAGLIGDVQEVLDAALNAAQTLGDEPKESRFRRRWGEILRIRLQSNDALMFLNEAETIAQRYSDEIGLALAWQIRSRVLQSLGRTAEAEHLARTTLEIAERLDNAELKVWANCRLFEFDDHLEWLDKAESLARELGWSRARAWILYQKGETLVHRGDETQAEPLLEQSLKLARSWWERQLIAANKRLLAHTYAVTGRPVLARQTAEEAQDICERIGLSEEAADIQAFQRDLQETNTLLRTLLTE